jgi:hypothetical protein
MTNDAEAREVHPTVTGSDEPVSDDRTEPADRPAFAGADDEVIDPDAVIIAEGPGDPDDVDDLDETQDDAHPDTVVAEAIVVEPVPAGARHAAEDAGTARPGPPVNGDAAEVSPMAGDPDLLHERWAGIQSTFVDDPRGSVTSAADMMSEVIATVVASAKDRESGLRGEWDRDGVDTEGLRNALRSYRSLLDQLTAL